MIVDFEQRSILSFASFIEIFAFFARKSKVFNIRRRCSRSVWYESRQMNESNELWTRIRRVTSGSSVWTSNALNFHPRSRVGNNSQRLLFVAPQTMPQPDVILVFAADLLERSKYKKLRILTNNRWGGNWVAKTFANLFTLSACPRL